MDQRFTSLCPLVLQAAILVLIFLAVSCAEHSETDPEKRNAIGRAQTAGPVDNTPKELTSLDREVLSAFLSDYVAFADKELWLPTEYGSYRVLFDQTVGSLRDNAVDVQMKVELGPTQFGQLSEGMRQDLKSRNQGRVSLADLELDGINVIIKKEANLRRTELGFFRDDEVGRGWIDIYLPGFNETRNKAVVRFRFGPTAHGASGTWLLEKVDDHWRVLWRDIAFYA